MAEHVAALEKSLRKLLEEKKYQTLKDVLTTMNGADVAAVFEDLDEERTPLLFRLLPKELAAEAFAELSSAIIADAVSTGLSHIRFAAFQVSRR